MIRLPRKTAQELGFDVEAGEELSGVADAAGRPFPCVGWGRGAG